MAASPTRKPVIAQPKGAVPPPRRRIRLTSLRHLRRELAAVYMAARLGEIPTSDGTRLANILDVLRRCLEAGEIEARIARLEAERLVPASLTFSLRGRP